MLKSDSLAKLAPALLKAQKNMGAALKDAKNPFFKSRFADLNSVIEASVPVLNDNDIVVLQTPTTVEGKSVIQTILLHSSGEFLASNTDVVVAKQNDPQAYGSAVSYARRYGLQSTVTLKAEDDDGENAMVRKSSVAQVTPVKTETSSASLGVSGATNENGLTAKVSAGQAVPAPFKRTRPVVKSNSGDIV